MSAVEAQVTVAARWPRLPESIGGVGEIADQVRADLRERGDVVDHGTDGLRVVVYHPDEVEAVADDVLEKLAYLGLPAGTAVSWVDSGGDHVRSLDAPAHPDRDGT